MFPGRFLLPSEAPLKHLDLLLWLLPEGLSDLSDSQRAPPLRLQSCVPSFRSDPHPPPDIWVAHRWYNRTPFHQTLVKNDRRFYSSYCSKGKRLRSTLEYGKDNRFLTPHIWPITEPQFTLPHKHFCIPPLPEEGWVSVNSVNFSWMSFCKCSWLTGLCFNPSSTGLSRYLHYRSPTVPFLVRNGGTASPHGPSLESVLASSMRPLGSWPPMDSQHSPHCRHQIDLISTVHAFSGCYLSFLNQCNPPSL